MGDIQITCSKQVSENCNKTFIVSKRANKENLVRNNGEHICLYCSRTIKFSGRANPNRKYRIDDNLLETIDTPEKAYLLGLISSDGHVNERGFLIKLHSKDVKILEDISENLFNNEIPIKTMGPFMNMKGINISSKKVAKDICHHLKISPGKKSDKVRFPDLTNELGWDFLRGYFDGDGGIRQERPQCNITSDSKEMLNDIVLFCKNNNIPTNRGEKYVEWYGTNMVDFLGRLYKDCSLYMERKKESYLRWCMYKPALIGHPHKKTHINNNKSLMVSFAKCDKDGVLPDKARVSDSGYDITLIGIDRVLSNGVIMCKTGIKVKPPFGYYFDLVARSSITKTGYTLSHSIGIIDRSYVGEILVPLTKIDDDSKDITFPIKLCQLVPREIFHFEILEVDSFDDEETTRGAGGFGSTDTPKKDIL